jgi:two-component system, cell cycle response regulator DivK
MRPHHIVGPRAGRLAEGEQRRLMAHQEIDNAGKETRIGCGMAQGRWIGARQRQETSEQFRLVCKPAKDGNRCFFGWGHAHSSLSHSGDFLPDITCFSTKSLYLQAVRDSEQSRAATYSDAAGIQAGTANQGIEMPKQVMIVEDNELNMKLFRDLIEASGYTTIQTRNGMEALDLARKHRPDLILMDIQLPEVSGLEVTKWLKEDDELHVIPVIAVTAFAMKGDEERIRQGGCEAYVSKPISVPKFIETIKTYLGDA